MILSSGWEKCLTLIIYRVYVNSWIQEVVLRNSPSNNWNTGGSHLDNCQDIIPHIVTFGKWIGFGKRCWLTRCHHILSSNKHVCKLVNPFKTENRAICSFLLLNIHHLRVAKAYRMVCRFSWPQFIFKLRLPVIYILFMIDNHINFVNAMLGLLGINI